MKRAKDQDSVRYEAHLVHPDGRRRIWRVDPERKVIERFIRDEIKKGYVVKQGVVWQLYASRVVVTRELLREWTGEEA